MVALPGNPQRRLPNACMPLSPRTGSMRRTVRSRSVAATVLAAALVLTGCSAGQKTTTADESSVLDGINASVGSMTLTALSIEGPTNLSYAKGDNAPVDVVIANSGSTSDQLVNVTTDAATSVGLFATPADAAIDAAQSQEAAAASSAASATGSAPASASGSATASDSASASDSATASDSASASSGVNKLSSLTVAGGARATIGYGAKSPVLVLQGLKQPLYPAQSIKITFTFEQAGTVTVSVPVHLIDPPASPPVVNVSPTAD